MKILLSIPLFLLPLMLLSQENHSFTIDEINTKIIANSSVGGFVKEITIKGSAKDNEQFTIPFGEMDNLNISNATYTNYSGKSKRLKNNSFFETSIPSHSFFSGYRSLIIPIPKTDAFEISYTITNPNLLFLSHIDFTEDYPTESATISIHLPEDHKLYYKLPEDSIPNLEITEEKNDAGHSYTFSYLPILSPVKSKKNDLPIFHKYIHTPPIARMIVCEGNKDPAQTINDRILKLSENRQQLNRQWINEIDAITANLITEREIAEKCFSFVQKEISYIDIENGLRALQPSDANDVLCAKKGDCKDMANLLVSILRYKGLTAYYAITPTTGHIFDLDFISTISCNHAVCLLRLDDEEIILDATDPYTAFGEPSMHTQGQKILIISEDGPELLAIPVCTPAHNKIEINISLSYEKTLSGQLNFKLKGKSRAYFQYMMDEASSDYKSKMAEHFIDLFNGKFELENVKYQEFDSIIAIKADMSVNSTYIIPINNMLYLNPSFLPKPYYYPPGDEIENTKIILPFSLTSDINCTIAFPGYDTIIPSDSLFFRNKNQLVVFRSKNTKPDHLQITVDYENQNLILEATKLEIFYELDKKIKKAYEKTIKVL